MIKSLLPPAFQRLAFVCIVLIGGSGCGGGSVDVAPDGIIAEPDDEIAFLFEQTEVPTFNFVLEPDDLTFLNSDPAAEQYVEGAVEFDGIRYEQVGIRYKGSIGAFLGCVAGGTLFEPSGEKTCLKLSMKARFDFIDPDKRFFGVKRLQFHSMNNDPSMLKERLAYSMFRESGVAAPRAAHAKLNINGEFAGVFALIEQIDGRFARSRFEEGGKGNLYKETWPGVADEAALLASLKTNRDEDPSVNKMLDFGVALLDGLEGPIQAIETRLDLDYMMRYLAVDRTIANDDGALHFYCPPGFDGCFNHNFYWYEEVETERQWLIPWDTDFSFIINGPVALPVEWNDVDAVCEPITVGFLPSLPTACDPLLHGLATYTDEYRAALRAFLDGPFAEDKIIAKLDDWETQLAGPVTDANQIDSGHASAQRWSTGVEALRSSIDSLRSQAESVASGSQ